LTSLDASEILPGLEIESIVQEILSQRCIPGATYRLQFNEHFTFRDAYALVPYLRELGITHCYASPLFASRQGSTHGYDVVNYNQLNPALGTEADFEALVGRLQEHGMGLIIDVVPNHMGIGPNNAWWMDVLENGPTSAYARYFDINWRPAKRELENKVLLPILEDHYGKVLEAGRLRLGYEDGRFSLYYYETRLPVAMSTCLKGVQQWCGFLSEHLPAGHDAVMEMESLVRTLRHLPSYTDFEPQQIEERQREQVIIQRRLNSLYSAYQEVRDALEATLGLYNGVPGDAESFDLLDALIVQQPYRLAYWRVAADEINYRRFFDINDMAAVRTEFPDVFDQTHQFLFRLLGEGKVSGVRVDHPDGLYNPQGYFQQLQEGYIRAKAERQPASQEVKNAVVGYMAAQLRRVEQMQASWPLYVVAEKILSEIEPLPADWAVYGTTGYDFMTAVNGIYVNRDNVHAFDQLYGDFIGHSFNYHELVYRMKKLIMTHVLASEIHSRAQQLSRIVERNRCVRNFTLNGLVSALTEVVACMSIYRTYITKPGEISARDRYYLETAVNEAKRRNSRTPTAIFDFVRDTLLLQNLYDFAEYERGDVIEFVMQFQQITGPVMAKSVEDTTFYIFNRLVSLNEVGGNPEQFGIGVDDFHQHNAWRREHWPHTMLSLSTHDTKRSGDLRARLNVLSEMPDEWAAAIQRWATMNERFKMEVDGELTPDRNDEYLLYQAMLGAWPLDMQTEEESAVFEKRIQGYMHKAGNEAKVHTNWANPNEAYGAAIANFIERIFHSEQFVEDMGKFAARLAYFGQWNSLSQTLLELTSPGVPDIYQGSELWDFSLVDPDNRRPIDYAHRADLLRELKSVWDGDWAALVSDLLANTSDGRIKLYLIAAALQFRREHISVFDEGAYMPLYAEGEKANHLCAFSRTTKDEAIVVITPVLVNGLTDGEQRPPMGEVWGDTQLHIDDGEYLHVFSGEKFMVKGGALLLTDALKNFPVALLLKER
jgi:(1->4)-alpha-D-glucan 1-alpha-D-glucosylmutase